MPLAAREIVKKKRTGKSAEQVLTEALKAAPGDSEISGYLKSLSAPASTTEATSESKPSQRSEAGQTKACVAQTAGATEMELETPTAHEPKREKAAKTKALSRRNPPDPHSSKAEKKPKTKQEKAKPSIKGKERTREEGKDRSSTGGDASGN